MKKAKIGIIGAMMEEIKKLEDHVSDQKKNALNSYLSFTEGTLEGHDVVFAASSIWFGVPVAE